jgi:multidrug efflux system membrane fusion protein
MRVQILLAGAALLVTSCGKEKQLEPAIQTVRAGIVEQIEPGPAGGQRERYSASIAPFAQVDLAFKSGGIVEHILEIRGADGRMRNVQSGDKVAKDTELARVRPLDYQQRVDQAEAQRAQSEAQLAQAHAQLAQARANYNEADIEYARASNLFQSASLVKPQYDQAKGRYEAGAASVAAAEATVKTAEAGVANAQAAVSEAKLSLSDTALRAPFAGWISARNVDLGSLVGNSVVGFTLVDTHLVKAVFAVPDSALATIRLGQKQPVTLEALQRTVPGVITSISPQADPKSRVFVIEVTLENSRENIRPGMIGSLTSGGGSHDSRPRLVVPLSAVIRAPADPNGFAVFGLTERDGKSYASARTIEIGQTFGNSIEVIRGLTAGQKIISLGAAQVRDGQQVSVLP